MSNLSERHSSALLQRLDELYLHGQTIIAWEELYLWYGVKKVAARTYRDLLGQWGEYLKARGENEDARPVSVHFKRQQGVYAAILRVDLAAGESLAELARRG